MISCRALQPLLLLLMILLVLISTSSGHRPLEVSLGRYNNLVIAIDRSVSENATLIEEIKAVIEDASLSLLLATRRSGQPGGLAFGNVSILVPDTWPNRPNYTKATWQLFSRSQLRVGPQNPRYGPVPHTEGGGGCGVPGEFTHYPTDFFLDKATAERLFGDRARLVVHEWGHFRWGLMDEAPQENDPHFYIYNNKFYPSRMVPLIVSISFGSFDFHLTDHSPVAPVIGLHWLMLRTTVNDLDNPHNQNYRRDIAHCSPSDMGDISLKDIEAILLRYMIEFLRSLLFIIFSFVIIVLTVKMYFKVCSKELKCKRN